MWRLKKGENEFQVTREGSFQYCKFVHGRLYAAIPPEEAGRFETAAETREATEPPKAQIKKGGEEK